MMCHEIIQPYPSFQGHRGYMTLHATAVQAADPYPSRAIPLRALEEDDYVEAVSAWFSGEVRWNQR